MHRISFGLSASEIDKAIRDVESYRNSIEQKAKLLRNKIAEKLGTDAQVGFDSSYIDEILYQGPIREAKVKIKIEVGDTVTIVVAQGEDAVWVEFGAGITHNTAAGTSPNPLGQELGFTIGSYGYGRGRRKSWGYVDPELGLIVTQGTPATMPMYNATKEVLSQIIPIAQEVFRNG